MQKHFSIAEVSKHNKDGDRWTMIGGKVYDVSKFNQHPGGEDKLEEVGGQDATKQFEGHSTSAERQRDEMYIGEVSITQAEVDQHQKEGDHWIVIEGQVVNFSEYLKTHQGDKGKSAPQIFKDIQVFPPFLQPYRIGVCLDGAKPKKNAKCEGKECCGCPIFNRYTLGVTFLVAAAVTGFLLYKRKK